jgi:hypothetical protein
MELSIIIVNWNSADYLEKCIRSINDQTKDINFEIIVVDNASYDGCDKMLQKEFPAVRFIQSKKNTGFAGANNLGYKYSSGKYLLFLNPDTEVQRDAINKILFILHSRPLAGIAGCRLLNSDLSLQTSCIQPFPTILNQVIDMEFFRKIFPKLEIWGIKPLYSYDKVAIEVDVISGACLMIKRNVFEITGLFSTDYFMYSEDVDLCWKVRREGLKTYYTGGTDIIHHGGGSAKRVLTGKDSFFSEILMKESRLKYFRKVKGWGYASLYRYSMLIASLLRIGIMYLLLPCQKYFKQHYNFAYSIAKWKKLLRWSLGPYNYRL